VINRSLFHARWDHRARNETDRAHPLAYDGLFSREPVDRIADEEGCVFMRKLTRGHRRGGRGGGERRSGPTATTTTVTTTTMAGEEPIRTKGNITNDPDRKGGGGKTPVKDRLYRLVLYRSIVWTDSFAIGTAVDGT